MSTYLQCLNVILSPASAQGGSLYKFWVEVTHAIWGDTELLHFHPKKYISNMKMSHFLMCKKFIKLLNTPPPWLYVNVVGFVEEKAVFDGLPTAHVSVTYVHYVQTPSIWPLSSREHPYSQALYMFPGHNLI